MAWLSVYLTTVLMAELRFAEDELIGGRVRWVTRGRQTVGSRWDRTVISLAGMASEMTFYGKISAGDMRDDLARARELAEEIASLEREHGRTLQQPWDEVVLPHSKALDVGTMFHTQPDPRVREIMNIAYRRAKFVINGHRPRIVAVAHALAERGSLDEKALREILGDRPFTLTKR